MSGWANWSGSQRHEGAELVAPDSEAALLALLAEADDAGRTVRGVGSSHSFVPFWTDDVIVSLDNLKGLVRFDADNLQATFRAGSKLFELGDPLWEIGMSMQNLGDIDRQSLAGAVSTGTHGTGRTLRNLSSQLVGLRIAKADGTAVELTAADGDLFRAAQVSLGTFGIITEATLQLVPAYFLHERNWSASVDECAAEREALIEENRHWEFFWDPASDTCAMKTLNVSEREEAVRLSDTEEIGRNYHILPSERDVKFNEIEFSVPAEAGWDCFLAVRALMQRDFPQVRWPLEYRTLGADDLMISSASGRETVTISAHQGVKHPFEAFFAAVEDVFRDFGGRPHWGKVHTHQADELRMLYPEFDRFCEIRSTLDPGGRFLNSFLAGVFGIR